jgi:hypothetical protein
MTPQDRATDLRALLYQAYPIPKGGSDRLDKALLRLTEAAPQRAQTANGAEWPRLGQVSPPGDVCV